MQTHGVTRAVLERSKLIVLQRPNGLQQMCIFCRQHFFAVIAQMGWENAQNSNFDDKNGV